jgi:hypothetical protein
MSKVIKSKNFDRNLDSKAMNKQIDKNNYKASEILRDTANYIAPIDSGDLRQNVTKKIVFQKYQLIYNMPYSGLRYEKNNKNPQTTHWVEKGYKKKKKVLSEIMDKGVYE